MSDKTRIPGMPDFQAIEAAAGGSATGRSEVFGLIGNLVYTWSNNESMLVYLIMLLLGTDRPSAVIVFGTLNTTRARVDLVQRLAKVKIGDREIARELKGLLARFDAGTKARNDLLHAMFTVDETGTITHTHAMRIEERGKGIRYGASKPMDGPRMEALRGEIQAMNELNRELWRFLPRLEAYLEGRAKATPARTPR